MEKEKVGSTFEESLKKLEVICQEMESETLTLEKSLSLYKEGKNIISQLNKLLEEAENEIKEESK